MAVHSHKELPVVGEGNGCGVRVIDREQKTTIVRAGIGGIPDPDTVISTNAGDATSGGSEGEAPDEIPGNAAVDVKDTGWVIGSVEEAPELEIITRDEDGPCPVGGQGRHAVMARIGEMEGGGRGVEDSKSIAASREAFTVRTEKLASIDTQVFLVVGVVVLVAAHKGNAGLGDEIRVVNLNDQGTGIDVPNSSAAPIRSREAPTVERERAAKYLARTEAHRERAVEASNLRF